MLQYNFLFQSPLIKPIITPRFALSCDLELLTALGKLARDSDVHVQVYVDTSALMCFLVQT